MPEADHRPTDVLWRPAPGARESTHLGQWMQWAEAEHGLSLPDYAAAWDWSVRDLDRFWSSIWTYFGLIGEGRTEPVLTRRTVEDATWFPELRLNWAENVLARVPEGVAVMARSQTRGPTQLTGPQLREQVARARVGLQSLGVRAGDRVAAYLPNIPEALVLLLASASLGAIFSSCPPEFGIKAVIDRFGQIEPAVLVTTDGYRHRGKAIDRLEQIAAIRQAVSSIRATVLVPYLNESAMLSDTLAWADFLAHQPERGFERVAFDHPLYILYSSGTSGPPKPLMHRHGGILIEHAKGHHLHHDLRSGDRFFWYSTTGWVMWNYLVSALLTGASIVVFDGDPGHPDLDTLWALAEETSVTVFGVSAPFLLSCRKQRLRPGIRHDLSRIRQLGSTGAPLPAEGFRWVYDEVGRDLLLVSISGGTDICAAFVGGAPLVPVIAGEIACRCLGVKVEAYDDDGHPVTGREGELVVTEPLPSMPVGFWGDDGTRYHASYFDRFPGVWAHGDWITINESGTCVVSGRSDATLNRGGVRQGTSDFYSVVEGLAEVADSLVVHLEDAEGGVGELLLFLQVADGAGFDAELERRIRAELRSALSPRHVPDTILAVPSIPKTLSGKKLEIPVKRLLKGAAVAEVASPDALLDPTSLDVFSALAARRLAGRVTGRTP